MQRALIAAGVLGAGSAIVFGAAAVTATLFPNGPMVASNGPMFMGKPDFGAPALPIPMPAPLPGTGIGVDDTGIFQVVGPTGVPVPTDQP